MCQQSLCELSSSSELILPLCPISLWTVVCFGLKWSNSSGWVVKQMACCCSDLVAPGDVAAVQRWGSFNRSHFAQQAHERWKCASRLRSSAWSEGELMMCCFIFLCVSDNDASTLIHWTFCAGPSFYFKNSILKYAHVAHMIQNISYIKTAIVNFDGYRWL